MSLTKKRNIWMGIAIIGVVLVHSGFNIPIFNYIREFGYGGVDIFMFCSGIGCYFSLSKNSDSAKFIKRRFFRLMPTYLVFIIPWLIINILLYHNISFPQIIGNIFCFGWLFGFNNQFSWYVDAIWVLYLITPILFSAISKNFNLKKLIGIIIFMLTVSVAFFNSELLLFFSRIPIYFIGMYFGYTALNKGSLDNKTKIILISLMVLGFIILSLCMTFCYSIMFNYGLFWYPFIFITPGLCVLISMISDNILNKLPANFANRGLAFIGKYTFEVYLLHVVVFEITKKLIAQNCIPNSNLIWLISCLAIIPAVIILVLLTRFIKFVFIFLKYKLVNNYI